MNSTTETLSVCLSDLFISTQTPYIPSSIIIRLLHNHHRSRKKIEFNSPNLTECFFACSALPGLKTMDEINAKYKTVNNGDDEDDDDDMPPPDEPLHLGFPSVCLTL